MIIYERYYIVIYHLISYHFISYHIILYSHNESILQGGHRYDVHRFLTSESALSDVQLGMTLNCIHISLSLVAFCTYVS